MTTTKESEIRPNLVQRVLRVLVFGLVTGGIASICSLGLVEAISWISQQLFTNSKAAGGINLALLIAPVVAGLIVGLMVKASTLGRPDNIANLIFQAQTNRHGSRIKDGLLNAAAAIIGMGGGASAGVYGPLSNMGASIGSAVGWRSRMDANTAIGCGVAAAISTVFSAPIAGILFAHEVVLRHYSMRSFAPITVASSVGFFVSNYLFTRPPLFRLEAERSFFAPEFFAFVVIGLLGALLAVVFMKTLLIAAKLAEQSKLPAWCRPAIAGLGVGLMAQWLPEATGVGNEVVTHAIQQGDYSIGFLLATLVAKIIMTAFCLGFGFVGGVFGPSLVIGALYGALIGQLLILLFGEMSSGIAFYGICGLVAVASPVIGGPLTAILIVFELTRNYELTTAAMISVAFSNLLAYHIFGRSLFDQQLRDQGVDLSLGRDKVILQRQSISSHVTTDAVTIGSETTLVEAQRAMLEANRQECYVLDELSRLQGKVKLSDVIAVREGEARGESQVSAVMDSNPLIFEHELSVWEAMSKNRKLCW